MITNTSKKNSFVCTEDFCSPQSMTTEKCNPRAEKQAHPLRIYLYNLWLNIRHFLGTDRWNRAVTLERGYSHYTMKMEDIEARWRNK
jgi:hypothetical protein